MLIIEGSDCLGKTTIVDNLSRLLLDKGCSNIVQHMTRPDGDFDFFNDYLPMISSNLIRDRFHLGGLAYHEEKYSAAELKVLEGWILRMGGVIVVLYAHNFRWYEEHIRKDTRGNLLDVEMMCEANMRFTSMVLHRKNNAIEAPYIDFAFDISPGFNSKKPNFVKNDMLSIIAETWIQRRKAVERWMQNGLQQG